jgi:GTPase KRas protein
MGDQYMLTGEGFLLVYSITSRLSFDEVSLFHQQILRVKDQDWFPIIMVANKCDLEFEREVSRNGESPTLCLRIHTRTHPHLIEGRNMAQQFGCQFIETSAKHRINVDEAFTDLVREIRRYNKVTTRLITLMLNECSIATCTFQGATDRQASY